MNLKEFKNPGKEYRASPFWSWNDKLENEELRWQVKEMKDKGFGGYFMHSRVGLKTPYLSEEWLDRIVNTLDEGKKEDMESWLYDEDKWPSGAAGGIVTEKKEEYRAKYLKKIEISKAELEKYLKDERTLAVFILKFKDGTLKQASRLESSKDKVENNNFDLKYVVFKMMTQAPSNWYNGQTYADLLNPEAVQEFMKVTYDYYKEHLGDDFGEYLPGVFTDEPNYINAGKETMPWTPEFEKYFQDLHAYDLISNLPALFYDYDNYHKIRYDFFLSITKRFITAFSKPLYDFCEKNNLKFTGHYLEEDTMQRQTNVIGAAMPHYEYMQVPGIDHLGRNINDPLTLKQCSSVAHQFGRNRVLCENFGVSGHSMSFEDQKWIADFHFALGITFMCQHLVLYSMVGDRKRDYPPTFSYHQPYWEDYKLINDYFARAGWVCSQGDFLADTLVLHPIASCWATFSKDQVNEYDQKLAKLQDNLLSAQIAFDFGDEIIMGNNVSIAEENNQVYLKIAKKGKYTCVIVPPSLTWSKKTYELLTEFEQKGGKVVFVGEKPSLIEGEKAENKWQTLEENKGVFTIGNNYAQIKETMFKLLKNELVIKDENKNDIKDIYIHSRQDGSNYLYFLANKSRDKTYKTSINLPVKGQVKKFNLLTGEINDISSKVTDNGLEIKAEFAPCASHAYLIDTSKKNINVPTVSLKTIKEVKLAKNCDFERTHKNSLTLDYCQYKVNDNNWSQQLPVWKVRKKMWYDSGLGEYDGVQPWVIEEKGVEVEKDLNLKLRWKFNSELEKINLGLVIEKAQDWQLKVNGQEIATETDKYYWDKQFGLIDISNNVKLGENIIELTADYGYGLEIEDIYLVGDFALKQIGYKDYLLSSEPKQLQDGSWVYQGYPFYAGNMIYKKKIELDKQAEKRYFLRLNKPSGSLYKIKVNNSPVQFLIAQPWELDITEYCQKGENELTIEVVGSLRNTFGPLHHRLAKQPWCGPGQFVDEGNWFEPYHFEDYGLLKGVSLLEKKY